MHVQESLIGRLIAIYICHDVKLISFLGVLVRPGVYLSVKSRAIDSTEFKDLIKVSHVSTISYIIRHADGLDVGLLKSQNGQNLI